MRGRAQRLGTRRSVAIGGGRFGGEAAPQSIGGRYPRHSLLWPNPSHVPANKYAATRADLSEKVKKFRPAAAAEMGTAPGTEQRRGRSGSEVEHSAVLLWVCGAGLLACQSAGVSPRQGAGGPLNRPTGRSAPHNENCSGAFSPTCRIRSCTYFPGIMKLSATLERL